MTIRALSRNTDPSTSAEAAASLEETTLTFLENEVFNLLTKHPEGLTSYEASKLSGISRVTVSPRFAPLKRRGVIHDSGERRTNPETNRCSIVWKVGQGDDVVVNKKEPRKSKLDLVEVTWIVAVGIDGTVVALERPDDHENYNIDWDRFNFRTGVNKFTGKFALDMFGEFVFIKGSAKVLNIEC